MNHFIKIKPIRANIEITNLCNLKCIHCYFYSNYPRRFKHEGLSYLKLKKLIKKLKNEGIFEISIGGGEPFCYSKIKEILSLATVKMFTIVSTNGLLLNKKQIEFLRGLSNFCLQISLDGKEKTHKKIRNINNYQFNQLIEIIQECVANKIDIKIGFMLCKLNLNEINYVCNFCIEKNIKKINILPYIGEDKKLKLTISDFYKAGQILKKYRSILQIDIRDPFLYSLVFEKKGYCWAGKLTFNINYQGKVSPCCYIINSNIGNIFDLKIKDIPKLINKKIIKIKDCACCLI